MKEMRHKIQVYIVAGRVNLRDAEADGGSIKSVEPELLDRCDGDGT
jgi:hypothetical protein